MINDEEVRRKFQQFGDVKAVKLAGDRNEYASRSALWYNALIRPPSQRYVEFFDTRVSPSSHIPIQFLTLLQAADEAHDRLRHQGLQDGVMDIIFAADNEDQRGASPR